MATHALTLQTTTGRTLYAYPNDQSLADWATYRVLLTEAASPNLGRYAFTLDDANGDYWSVFEGATQPTSWDAALWDVDLTSKQAAASGGLDAAGIRSAIGLASANLDSQLTAIPESVLDAGNVDGYSLEEAARLMLSVLAGKVSGGLTTTTTIRAADDSKTRVTATVDSNGNRTALTLDAN